MGNGFPLNAADGTEIVDDEMEIVLWEGVPIIQYQKPRTPLQGVHMLDNMPGMEKRELYSSVLKDQREAVFAEITVIENLHRNCTTARMYYLENQQDQMRFFSCNQFVFRSFRRKL